MINTQLIKELYRIGLGELYILHPIGKNISLCKLVYAKEKLCLKEIEVLTEYIKAESFAPCWQYALLGALSKPYGMEWESLTFNGVKHTNIPDLLTDSRHDRLLSTQNGLGDLLFDFVGSVYRGYRLMLDQSFLPVVILKEVKVGESRTGIAVTDLRSAPLPVDVIRKYIAETRALIDRYVYVQIEDLEVSTSEFDELFNEYLNRNS